MSHAYTYEEDQGEQEQAPPFDLSAAMVSHNLAFDLDASTLAAMAATVIEEYQIDEDSRKAWKLRHDAAMKLALQIPEEKNTPWPKASNVKFPLISTTAIQFNARAYPALIDGPDVVKGAVKGRPDPEKIARAERVARHMSYQLLEEMDDWEEDTDRLLMQLPIVGCAFRKSYFDPIKGYNCSILVSAADFVVNYWTKDLATCPRGTHILTYYPHEVREKMRSGLWLDVDLGRPESAANDDQAPHTFYEQHRLWDLDGDDYPEPYIITVEKDSQQVVRVVARFEAGGIQQARDGEIIRITPTQTFTKYPFIPAPDGSFYDIGFGALLAPISGSIDTALNQMFDAATLANMGGGVVGAGVGLKSGAMTRKLGEWKKIEVSGQGSLRDNMFPWPVSEPSPVLFSLLGMLIDAAKDVTATQDILGGDAGRGTLPVGTVSALIEQGLKTFTAIVKRIHRALKKELKILYDLNGRYLQPQAYFNFQDQPGVIAQADYAPGDMDVSPTTDPRMSTDMQRMQQAQLKMEVAGQAGGDVKAAAKSALRAARVPEAEIEEMFPTPQGPPPPDPKLMIEQAKAENAANETRIKGLTAAANAEKTQAETEALQIQNMMAAPQFMAAMDAAVHRAVQETLARLADDGQPEPVHQPGAVPGMAPQPVNGAVPEFPGGPTGRFDGTMGPGPGDGAGGQFEGPPALADDGLGLA